MTMPPTKLPTSREFARLDRPGQLEALRRASSRQKLRLLLDAGNGEELLALLPPQDVYLLAREFGPDQVSELLTMASPEQWTAFFDFDCWEGDAFDARAARDWLAVLLEGSAAQVAATLQAIDFELLVLMLHCEMQVVSGPEELADENAMVEGRRRECGYVLNYHDEDGAKLYGRLIDVLFREAPGFCRYLLEAVRSEGMSLLEESVYQQRAGRLLDQGLPEPHAARSVYAWLDPADFVISKAPKLPLGGSVTGVAPGVALQLARPGGVLAEVLSGGVDEQTAWELASLVNKVIMAEQVDLGDLEAVRGLTARSYAMLNLALEYLAGSDATAAARYLRDAYAEQLFRLGYSLTLGLQRRARVVCQAACGAYLDGPYRLLTDALLQSPPQFAEVLVRPDRGSAQLFASLREVRLTEEWLNRLEVQGRLFETRFPFRLPPVEGWDLVGCHPGHGRELTLSTIFLTALANRLLHQSFAPQPLAAGDLPELHILVSRGRGVDPQLRAQTLSWLESLEPGGGAFGDFCLNRWEEEFCAVSPAGLDPRFIGGLIVKLGGRR
jgi:hypothetical protein